MIHARLAAMLILVVSSAAGIGGAAYVSNFDTARRDNLAADGKTSIDGIGASIIKIER